MCITDNEYGCLTSVYPYGYTAHIMHYQHLIADVWRTIVANRRYVVLFVAIVFGAGWYYLQVATRSHEVDSLQVNEAPYILSATTSVPLAIEGILTATEDAVIAAQTHGRLTSVAAREGATVRAGDVLAVVGQPVLSTERDALRAKIVATEASRGLAETAREGAQSIATVRAQGGVATTEAQVALAESEYRAARDALVSTLQANYLVATEALKFLADTSALGTSEVNELRNEAARELAGVNSARYLGQNVLASGSTDGFLDELDNALAGESNPEDATYLAFAERLRAGLTKVALAYAEAERPAYERTSNLTDDERASYNSYRNAVRAAEGAVVSARSTMVSARTGYDAARAGAQETVLVRSEEQVQAEALRADESAVSVATLASMRAELRALDSALGEAVIRAPYSGVVTAVYVDPGAYVQQGTPVVRMQSTSGLEVEAVVPARYVAGLVPGASVVLVDGTHGVLNRVAPQVDEHTGGVRIFVVIDGAAQDLVAGERVRGELALMSQGVRPVYAVPHTYVHFDFSGPVVRTADGEVPVSVVRDTADYIYVTGEKLSEGVLIVR